MSTASEFDLIVKPNFQTKSAIWKHFGFPADDKGRITDKKKTICRLCQAVVAYSGNTINLKFHLQRATHRSTSRSSNRTAAINLDQAEPPR